MKINYQKKLDRLIAYHQSKGEVPTLLLHSCCAPCSSYCIEYLSNYFKITVLYFNPNIGEKSEYLKRRDEQKKLISKMKTKYEVKFIDGDYKPQDFYDAVQGFENEPERGKRCAICFALRLNVNHSTYVLTLRKRKATREVLNFQKSLNFTGKIIVVAFFQKETESKFIALTEKCKCYFNII